MESSAVLTIGDRGIFEARYLAFLETINHLRPKLHRYCARMTGSVLDGEDVMQDALFQAYRKLDAFDDSRPLAPWLFRIAHNQCIDFLRRRDVRERAEAEADLENVVPPVEALAGDVGRAIEHLVLALPPKERACVLLKDVFDYSLEEVAELVDSTVGGVKAALHRGRARIAALPEPARAAERAQPSPEATHLLHLYIERFNRRDWDGLRELIARDARVSVADRYAGSVANAPYFSNYAKRAAPWRATLAEIEGERVIVVLGPRAAGDEWIARGIVRLGIDGSRIVGIVDYNHCPWVLSLADVTLLEE